MGRTGIVKFILVKDILFLSVLLVVSLIFVISNGVTAGVVLSIIGGTLIFLLNEYITHRFVFHIKAPKNLFALKLLKRLHYDHHKDPNDLHLMFLPIWYSVPQITALSFIYYMLVNSLVYSIAMATGLMSMLLVYEWKHFVAHQPITPKTKFGKMLKQTHLLHHYKNENYWYGVSNPFVDMLFGTQKDEKEVEKSSTVRNIVGDGASGKDIAR